MVGITSSASVVVLRILGRCVLPCCQMTFPSLWHSLCSILEPCHCNVQGLLLQGGSQSFGTHQWVVSNSDPLNAQSGFLQNKIHSLGVLSQKNGTVRSCVSDLGSAGLPHDSITECMPLSNWPCVNLSRPITGIEMHPVEQPAGCLGTGLDWAGAIVVVS